MIQFIVVSSFFLQDYISFIFPLVFFFLVFFFGVVVFLFISEDLVVIFLSDLETDAEADFSFLAGARASACVLASCINRSRKRRTPERKMRDLMDEPRLLADRSMAVSTFLSAKSLGIWVLHSFVLVFRHLFSFMSPKDWFNSCFIFLLATSLALSSSDAWRLSSSPSRRQSFTRSNRLLFSQASSRSSDSHERIELAPSRGQRRLSDFVFIFRLLAFKPSLCRPEGYSLLSL